MVRISSLKKMADIAKEQVDKRGGTDALKDDLKEVSAAFKGEGSIQDKAKKAADAVKRPAKNAGEADK